MSWHGVLEVSDLDLVALLGACGDTVWQEQKCSPHSQGIWLCEQVCGWGPMIPFRGMTCRPIARPPESYTVSMPPTSPCTVTKTLSHEGEGFKTQKELPGCSKAHAKNQPLPPSLHPSFPPFLSPSSSFSPSLSTFLSLSLPSPYISSPSSSLLFFFRAPLPL